MWLPNVSSVQECLLLVTTLLGGAPPAGPPALASGLLAALARLLGLAAALGRLPLGGRLPAGTTPLRCHTDEQTVVFEGDEG